MARETFHMRHGTLRTEPSVDSLPGRTIQLQSLSDASFVRGVVQQGEGKTCRVQITSKNHAKPGLFYHVETADEGDFISCVAFVQRIKPGFADFYVTSPLTRRVVTQDQPKFGIDIAGRATLNDLPFDVRICDGTAESITVRCPMMISAGQGFEIHFETKSGPVDGLLVASESSPPLADFSFEIRSKIVHMDRISRARWQKVAVIPLD